MEINDVDQAFTVLKQYKITSNKEVYEDGMN